MKTIRLRSLLLPLLAASTLVLVPSQASAITPAEQAGMAPGTIHKVGVGLGVAKFRVIKMGENGWVMVECQEDNNAGWRTGEKYWLNTNAALFISAPFKAAAAPAETAPPEKKPPAKRPLRAP